MNTAPFKIVTPDGVIYEDDITQVSIPTETGEITILPKHIPLVSVLKAGEMRIKKDDYVVELAVSTGILEVRPNGEISVLAETAERAEHIDIERAEEARKRAEKLLEEYKDVEDVAYIRLVAKIEKELARIRVAHKYKK